MTRQSNYTSVFACASLWQSWFDLDNWIIIYYSTLCHQWYFIIFGTCSSGSLRKTWSTCNKLTLDVSINNPLILSKFILNL
jgi:hypothetical protein